MNKLNNTIIFTTLFISCDLSAIEYIVKKGDTLWNLSKKYLNDPFLWSSITYGNKSKILLPQKLSISATLNIPDQIANNITVPYQKDLQQYKNGRVQQVTKETIPLLTSNKHRKNQLHFIERNIKYMNWNEAPLIITYRNGQFISIPVPPFQPLDETVLQDNKSLGINIQIDAKLLNKIFTKDH